MLVRDHRTLAGPRARTRSECRPTGSRTATPRRPGAMAMRRMTLDEDTGAGSEPTGPNRRSVDRLAEVLLHAAIQDRMEPVGGKLERHASPYEAESPG